MSSYNPKVPLKRVIRDVAASTISTASWVSFTTNLPADVFCAEFFNSTGQVLEVGYGQSTAAVNVLEYYIVPGGPAGQVGFLLNKGHNVYLRSVGTASTAGIVVANFLR